jgi:hypothetical protein
MTETTPPETRVPIPYRDAADLDDLGLASFLRIERSARGSTYLGALFTINARGEPIELVYNALETPHPLLWRPADLRRHAERRLTTSLLTVAESEPRLLFGLTDEIGVELFGQDVHIELPVGRVERPASSPAGSDARAIADPAAGATGAETGALPAVPSSVHVFWQPAPPPDESDERILFEQLAARGLLLEPFDRAVDALREVYGPRSAE